MNNQEIFTLEERNKNNERKHELIELVASEEAVLIVGAGSSVRVGYPDWFGLLTGLEDLASKWVAGFKPDKGKRKDDPLTYVDDIKSHICDETGNLDRYHNLLYELFGRRSASVDNFHKMLVSLPFRGILTTNYDIVLEAALSELEQQLVPDKSLVIDGDFAAPVHEFLMEMLDTSTPRRIAHLHGKYDNWKSIILSRKDYQRAYEGTSDLNFPGGNQARKDSEWTLHRKLLWAVLATRRVVFVGFSMCDPYLNEMLDAVSKDLWRWDKSTHYAIMSISPERSEYSKAKKLKRDYGIDTVFYENFDRSHPGLVDVVSEIFERCNVEDQRSIDAIEGQPPIDEDGLDWLEQMNQRMEGRIGDEN